MISHKPVWEMTPKEREEFERKREKFDPKSIFNEIEPEEQKPLFNGKGYEGTVKDFFEKQHPKTKNIWEEDKKKATD